MIRRSIPTLVVENDDSTARASFHADGRKTVSGIPHDWLAADARRAKGGERWISARITAMRGSTRRAPIAFRQAIRRPPIRDAAWVRHGAMIRLGFGPRPSVRANPRNDPGAAKSRWRHGFVASHNRCRRDARAATRRRFAVVASLRGLEPASLSSKTSLSALASSGSSWHPRPVRSATLSPF